MAADPPANSNGEKMVKLLANLNWPTVALIALTGGGNWLATNRAEHTNTIEMERARSEVHQIHAAVDGFEKYMRISFENQNKILENQNQMMRHDADVLRNVNTIVERFERWKQAEQMRGAPQ